MARSVLEGVVFIGLSLHKEMLLTVSDFKPRHVFPKEKHTVLEKLGIQTEGGIMDGVWVELFSSLITLKAGMINIIVIFLNLFGIFLQCL